MYVYNMSGILNMYIYILYYFSLSVTLDISEVPWGRAPVIPMASNTGPTIHSLASENVIINCDSVIHFQKDKLHTKYNIRYTTTINLVTQYIYLKACLAIY